jgi:hypothetical protein
MKKIVIIFILFCSLANAQVEQKDLVAKPVYIFKFGPRIFSPRFGFEKIINKKSSYALELRTHLYWVPQALRLEATYRRYFLEKAPYGAYFNVKAAFGYFDYRFLNGRNANGVMTGAGFTFGGQFKMGKNWLVDVFGGAQVIVPIYFQISNNANNYYYYRNEANIFHYTLIACPLEIGIRFGHLKSKWVPKDFIVPSEVEF